MNVDGLVERLRASRVWKPSVLLGILLAGIYLVNCRELGAGDTIPASQLPTTILRGEGIHLDRFYPDQNNLPYWVADKQGHVISRYPLAPGLLALPFEIPQILLLDLFCPGWDERPAEAGPNCAGMAKLTSALLGALTGVALYQLFRQLGLGGWAWWGALAAALGSSLWCTASQALWQHGPAALALTLAMLLLAPVHPSPRRLLLAGLCTGSLVCFRSLDVVFAAAIFLGVAWRWPRGLGWYLPFPLLLGGLLLAYNQWYFGTLAGGQVELAAYHPGTHHVEGIWTGHLLEGAAGTLVSPSRGLLVFTPWVVPAVLLLPMVGDRLRERPVLLLLTVSLVPYGVLLSKYSVWWGGCCFGPRFWTDALPVFAVLLGLGLAWSRQHSRAWLWIVRITIVLGVLVQVIGAFCYPSTFNGDPDLIDVQHERLWDWWDGELMRCLREGPYLPRR
jgi:hypothetical protein